MPRDEDLIAPSLPPWTALVGEPGAALTTLDPTDAVLVLPVRDLAELPELLAGIGLPGSDLLAAHDPGVVTGRVTTIPLPPGRYAVRTVLVVGLGEGSGDDWRAAGAAVGRATRERPEVLHVVDEALAEGDLAAYVEGAVLGGWAAPRWTAGGIRAGVPATGRRVVLTAPGSEQIVAPAVERARAQLVARSLATVPPNVKSPAWLAATARRAARRTGLEVRVWTERDLRREGFGGLLAVGGGSATPPRLVRLEYRPQGGSGHEVPHVVLVGKGITFDTGGLQVKPADGMLGMKTDMSGAGIVLAVLQAARALDLRVRVTGLLAIAENAVSGSAYRPGDVLTQYGGRTVEIGNTDAEGRIVLADALAYAVAELDPDHLVDIATLTGAARIALGRAAAPVFSTDDGLRDALVTAGSASGETVWPMPLPPAYRRGLDSDVADLTHISAGGMAGSVTAALFLREFVGDRSWAHLDIAGTGRSDVDAGALTKGATGFGTRLLLHWLEGLGTTR